MLHRRRLPLCFAGDSRSCLIGDMPSPAYYFEATCTVSLLVVLIAACYACGGCNHCLDNVCLVHFVLFSTLSWRVAFSFVLLCSYERNQVVSVGY